jgi:hypothetical protein
MPNQMVMPKINLLKLPDPAAQTAKFVNMMNATRQQEAAERQAQQAQQQMTLAAKEDAREEALQGPRLTKAQQDNAVQALEMFRERVGDIAEGDVAAAEAVRADLVSRIPGYDQFIPPASQWTRDTIERLMMTSEKEIDKLYATPVASVAVNDRTGQTTSVTAGGRRPRAETIYEADPAPAPAGAAPRTPMAPQTPTGPARTGKFGEALVVPDSARPLTADQQDHIRRMQEDLGMSNTPASTNSGRMATPTAGQMSPDMVPAILDAAVQTGVMAQIDLDQMLALAPPQARQGIMDVVRNNNINLQADAPSLAASGMAQQQQQQQQPMAPNPVQRPQAQFADMRGPAPRAQTAGLGGDMPMMRQTQAQSQGRTPFIARREAPLPGSAQVPIERVRAEGVAGRESPAEAAAKARAVAGATADAEFAKKTAEKAPGRNQVSTLIKKVRAAYEQLDRAKAIPSETRGGFANAMDYFGTSSLGREAQKMVGTKSSKYLSEIINSRKLLATAIKNATGMSAQEMNSNVELQLTLDALTDPTQGIEAARTTLDTLEELYGAPRAAAPTAAAPRAAVRTPVIPDAAKQMLRKNPSPQQRAFFDRTFGKGAAAKVLGVR